MPEVRDSNFVVEMVKTVHNLYLLGDRKFSFKETFTFQMTSNSLTSLIS